MHPVLLDFGRFKVFSYGFMMVIGYLATLFFNYKYSEKAKIPKMDAINLTIYVFFSGILGARFIYIIQNLKFYSTDWHKLIEFQKGGLSWHGGFLGAGICIIIFCLKNKLSILAVSDVFFPNSIIGLAFGRIGCFLNGCCYGKPCNLPWAVTFPHHAHPQPVHPTQIYEMLLDIVAFIFLLYWLKNRRKFYGETTMMTFASYSVARFVMEIFRYNTPDQYYYGFSVAQWFSIATFIIMVAGIIVLRRFTPEKLSVKGNEKSKTVNA